MVNRPWYVITRFVLMVQRRTEVQVKIYQWMLLYLMGYGKLVSSGLGLFLRFERRSLRRSFLRAFGSCIRWASFIWAWGISSPSNIFCSWITTRFLFFSWGRGSRVLPSEEFLPGLFLAMLTCIFSSISEFLSVPDEDSMWKLPLRLEMTNFVFSGLLGIG